MHVPADPQSSPLLCTLEEGTQLLRQCGVRGWAWWLAGSCPFAVGLIYFVNDMGRGAEAAQRLPENSLALALLYWWMACAHSAFGDTLLRQLRNEPTPPKLPLRGRLRLLASQALFHASALWILPLSLLALLPFAWAYAACQNASIMALTLFRKGSRTRDLLRTAMEHSRYRQGQNHAILLALMVLFLVVFLNIHAGILNTALLFRYITGEENTVSRNPMLLLNTGLIVSSLCAAYLVTGPLLKAVYALRCFRSLSYRSGEDLAITFKRARNLAPTLAALLIIGAATYAQAGPPTPTGATAEAATTAPEKTANSASRNSLIPPEDLRKSIQQALQKPAFQWRFPRAEEASRKHSWLGDFLDDLRTLVSAKLESVSAFFEKLLTKRVKEWFKKLWNSAPSNDPDSVSPASWAGVVQTLMKWLLAALGAGLAVIMAKNWRMFLPSPAAPAPTAIPRAPDLEDQQVLASALHEEDWLRLAAAKEYEGDHRLALRALFLASLSHLGERKLLQIHRAKSNGDYLRELALRARDRLELRASFSQNVRSFEGAWYGGHRVEASSLEAFRAAHQRIISDGNAS